MEIKIFEVRDAATFIPAIGIAVSGDDGYLARSSGYGNQLILFGRMEGGPFSYDPYQWGHSRTMHVAHKYVSKNWDDLQDKDVIDVEFILGVRDTPKVSQEREERWQRYSKKRYWENRDKNVRRKRDYHHTLIYACKKVYEGL